jgi:hypothetical protein
MNPPAPNPRNQALAWAQVFREDWEECRDDPDYAPSKAWSLLAAWGGVCRFFPPEALPAEASAVFALVHQDAAVLLNALRQAPEPAEWLERARGLDGAWDFATGEEVVRELETAAVTLFDELDRHSLAACMAARLDPAGASAEWLAAWQRQVEEAEGWFRDHVEAFLPAAPLAAATLAACRPGLEDDEALWQTVLKHRVLEEAVEEAEAEPALPRLSESDKRAILAKLDRACPNGMPRVIPISRQGQQLQAYSREVLPPSPIAAAPAVADLPETLPLKLFSPGRAFEARILVPTASAAGNEVVRLNCYEVASGEAALRLARATICLAGVERRLDDRARADFTLQELRDSGEELFLEVAGETWTPEPNP